MAAPLLLASTSRYRRELLARLRLPFTACAPADATGVVVDETPVAGEAPQARAVRLAEAKAAVLAARFPQAWVIGSDQVAELEGRTLGKPGDAAGARAQLAAMSGRYVEFHTAVCLACDRQRLQAHDTTRVHLRSLSAQEIARYVEAEQPLDCAGSFKCEGLGIVLFESIETCDPTALIGLPLIATARLLRQAGFVLP